MPRRTPEISIELPDQWEIDGYNEGCMCGMCTRVKIWIAAGRPRENLIAEVTSATPPTSSIDHEQNSDGTEVLEEMTRQILNQSIAGPIQNTSEPITLEYDRQSVGASTPESPSQERYEQWSTPSRAIGIGPGGGGGSVRLVSGPSSGMGIYRTLSGTSFVDEIELTQEEIEAKKKKKEEEFKKAEIEWKKLIKEFLHESNKIEREYSKEALADAIEAWDYLYSHDEINIDIICMAHSILMKSRDLEKQYKGALRDIPVFIGGKEAMKWPLIKDKLEEWCRSFTNSSPWTDDVAYHVEFEAIHPFADGNGRIGRMLLNWGRMKLKHQEPIIIHEGEEQLRYYQWFRQQR